MSEFLKTKTVYTYFLLDALTPKTVDRKKLMDKLTGVFGVKSENLFELCSAKAVAEIRTLGQYNRYLRLKMLNGMEGYEHFTAESTELDDIISVKGQVLSELERLKLKTMYVSGTTEVLMTLANGADTGIVTAMYCYGILLCDGIGVGKDLQVGLRNLQMAADWCNVEACILCLHYNPAARQKYLDKMYTYLVSSPYCDAVDALAKKYRLKPHLDELTALTRKMFQHGVAKKILYDSQVARILTCMALNEPDKQDILLSGGKEMVKAVSALPLNLTSWDDYEVCACPLPFGTAKERSAVELALKNVDTLKSEKFRPLCICSEETYALKVCKNVIKNTFAGCNIIDVDLAMLSETALEPTADNEVLRGIKEKNRNVVVFTVCGSKIPDAARLQKLTYAMCNFLNTAHRSSYKMKLGVSLNLVELFPVVLCDKRMLGKFRAECQVVKLASMTQGEKRAAIEATVADNASLYELHSVKVNDDAMELLLKTEFNSAIEILDKLFVSYGDGADVTVTVADIQGVADETERVSKIGFHN